MSESNVVKSEVEVAKKFSPAAIKKTEAQEQAIVVSHFRAKYPGVFITTTGAGMGFHVRYQAQMNRQGYTKGTPDLFIMTPRGPYHALVIEMKTLRGDPTLAQKQVQHCLAEAGYRALICFGAEQAIAEIDKYMSLESSNSKN